MKKIFCALLLLSAFGCNDKKELYEIYVHRFSGNSKSGALYHKGMKLGEGRYQFIQENNPEKRIDTIIVEITFSE